MKAAEGPGGDRSLNRHMLVGSIWMILLRWAIRLTGLVSTVILARLLNPSDFGIVAMAMFMVGMLELLSQSGQKLAIIRHAAPTRADYDTAWTLSVLVGFFVAAAIVALAPLTSLYFHEPRVVPVMQWLALRSLLGGCENIGTTDFRRDLRFDRFFSYNVYPKLVSFLVTIGLALILRNYWALVAGIIVSQLATIVLSFVMHPYRPRFSLAKLNEIGSFSSWTLVKTIGNYLNSQLDQIAVGGAFGTVAMGRYAVAADVASSPSKELNEPMVAVLYPVMAKARAEPEKLRSIYMRAFSWSAVICLSTSVGVTMIAHDFVALVLGSKWMDVEPLMGWLALGAGVLGLSSGAYSAFDTIGKPHLGARMQWVRLLLLGLALVPITLLFRNMVAVAICRLVMTTVFIPTLLFAIGREIDISPAEYLKALWRPVLAAGIMSIALYFLNAFLGPGALRLFIDILAGAISFPATLLLAWQISRRPVGPETDIIAFATGVAARWSSRWPAPQRSIDP